MNAIDDRANETLNDVRVSAENAAVYPTCPDHAPIGGNCGYQKMMDASLAQRYRLADWGAVALACDSQPGRCDDPVRYELLLVDSHNQHVRDDAARAENEIEAQRAEDQRRHMDEQVALASAVIGEVAYATHEGPKCRSCPSVFAGVTNTVCTP